MHRLVAQAFIPNPQNKKEVNHIDGNKENNCVWNLEWVTSSENTKHTIRTGLVPHSKVQIVETGEIFETAVECANKINGSYGNIYKCLKGERKTHKGFRFRKVV